MAGVYDNKADEQCVAHGAAEPSGLKIETRSPRPGERNSFRGSLRHAARIGASSVDIVTLLATDLASVGARLIG